MSELFEIVLENIPKLKVCSVYLNLLKEAGEIEELQCSERLCSASPKNISKRLVKSFLDLPCDATLTVKLNYLTMNEYDIPSVLLRLVKYGDKFDIDFNFDESAVNDFGVEVLMKKMHAKISKMAKQHNINNWFGGMEPACDTETRFFTKEKFKGFPK